MSDDLSRKFASTVDIHGMLEAARKAGRDAERNRIAAYCLAEFKRWRDAEAPDTLSEAAAEIFSNMSMGAMGAASNILAATYDLLPKPTAT